MENASKALIMAGSGLIALIIISCLVLMINNLSTYQGLQTQSEEVAQIEKFNNQYIIYNRDDVRGSDLYSLMNKVIDYNIRQSTEGKELGQNGQYVGYRPMSISIDLKSYQSNLAYLDGKNRLFTSARYAASGTNNGIEGIKEKITNLENTEFDLGTGVKISLEPEILTNLVTASTKIFVGNPNDLDNEQKSDAVQNFYRVLGYNMPKNDTNTINTIYKNLNNNLKEKVYTYAEYIQFKRAIFKCTDVKYDESSGRIIKMEFECTGNFN